MLNSKVNSELRNDEDVIIAGAECSYDLNCDSCRTFYQAYI